MSICVLPFQKIDGTMTAKAGGKGAGLGELAGIDGIRVPDGFCITTEAYGRITENNRELDALLDELATLRENEREQIRKISARIRGIIERIPIPADMAEEIEGRLAQYGPHHAFAVRSSATAEDLPTASFAGQQETYLNVIGTEEILKHIGRCWASLFTERAVTYRIRNGFDHRKVRLAVLVQKMVFPQASGILFTADPVTSSRRVASIDAGFGLGEGLVSGRVNPDVYKVRSGRIIEKKISAKKLALHADKDGGTTEREIDPERQNAQALTDEQILQLERIGRRIEEHFGSPQDIEWSLADDTFHILQSRPITTLFPVPQAGDRENHVYVSVGHQQMMTDPLKPLGISVWQRTAARPMFTAGGRLFVDVTPQLASPAAREMLLNAMGQHDPLIRDALMTIIERGDFIQPPPEGGKKEKEQS